MKTKKWLLIGLLLVFATGACWQVFAEELSAPEKPWGREYAGGGRAMGFSDTPPMFGLAARDPELAGLVRDIFALRQINRADLNVKQIEGVLPILRNLARDKESLISETKEALLKERARLLRQQGPDEDKTARPALMRDRLDSHREKAERAKAQLRQVLSAPQAEILAEMLGPPEGFRHRHRWGDGEPGRGGGGGGGGGRHMERGGPGPGPGDGMGPGREMRRDRDGKGRDRMGGRGGGGGRGMGMGRAHPAVDIDRLISLLEEKHAAMRK
ncbi:MAG: hypothetical protein GTO55_09535 [Armatimonadetes bacterium]|nr:hypothetical protein [Armatimonadota bacterium]NIM24489.1 hypothetical protein [Armatimonadota bacterium]NIM68360.1 hypothetical protein [Armatimonadota bacterium]NIM76760.1 hypothetical protein [Armatimonadota bacterium]NIN06562.1 hypothetical protein [Armatimonadota bacterium]